MPRRLPFTNPITNRSVTEVSVQNLMKQKCRSLMNRFGKRTRRQSTDFSYNPISYALNFEDARSDQLPQRKFPATPTRSGRRLTREASRGVAAVCG
ncbi:hypothetical protein QQ045_016643 [Rhodiola kirilowii]